MYSLLQLSLSSPILILLQHRAYYAQPYTLTTHILNFYTTMIVFTSLQFSNINKNISKFQLFV